jgi:hypothetical protein
LLVLEGGHQTFDLGGPFHVRFGIKRDVSLGKGLAVARNCDRFDAGAAQVYSDCVIHNYDLLRRAQIPASVRIRFWGLAARGSGPR